MFIYLLKVSVVLGVALLFYKSVLQQESFFTANRFYLLLSIVLAFALPFVELPQLVSHQGYMETVFQPATPPEAQTPPPAATSPQIVFPPEAAAGEQVEISAAPGRPSYRIEERGEGMDNVSFTLQADWLYWLGLLYLFGVAVFTLNLLLQAGSLLIRVFASADKIRDGDFVIVNMEKEQAPCSFFHYLFIYPEGYDFATYEQIIAHEKIHARKGHTLDMLLAEIAVIVLWFNPLMWLYKREIEKNVEYQTDALLLQEVPVNKHQYQLSLLRIACPNKPLSITTNYNQSLLKQRIMRMNAQKSTPHSYWKYSFLAPLFFVTILFLNEPASSTTLPANATLHDFTVWDFSAPSQVNDEPEPVNANADEQQVNPEKAGKEQANAEKERVKTAEKRKNSMSIQGSDTDMNAGYWYSHQENNQYCLDLKGSRNTSSWNISRCFDKGLFRKKGNKLYMLTKETGTLQFTGNLEAEVSQGKYTFTPDASFKKYLADNKLLGDEKNFMFHLFLGDIDKRYVEFLWKNNNTLEGERLLELAIHGIPMKDYQGYMALFEEYGDKKPSVREVVEAKIHGIDQAYVQELQAQGFKNLPLKKMMEAKIHGVNGAYIQSMRKAGFADMTMDKMIEAKIHGLNPIRIKEIQALGFGELPLDKMMQVKIHGVDASYITDLKSAGFGKLTLDEVIEARIHGLTAASANEIRNMGFKDLSYRDILTAQIHDVDASYVAELKKAGLQNLSMDDAVAAKIHGIDSEFIQKAKKEGYKLETVDEYVTLKIHGMALESLKKKK
ncbi:hypothetical protein GCM10023188_04490 [Pontibacter saemangeumensis]|uniref:Peptidase M56 domain-containing protein n=1 Tax=Pontibacter saemangeumensis TaxID=1084525 RepID=A0ABP8L958_9BACT